MTTKEQALERLNKAKALLKKIEAVENTKNRKLDTKRKIVLGGWMIAEARKSPAALQRLKDLISGLPEKDRKAFDGWDVQGG